MALGHSKIRNQKKQGNILIKKTNSRIAVLIAGGSGSGKSTLAENLARERKGVLHFGQDNYYKDLSHLSPEKRNLVNFDHPDSIDNQRLLEDLQSLLAGKTISRPIYDFASHSRKAETEKISSQNIILCEGTFFLHYEEIRKLCPIKIYLELSDDLRFIRRLNRDLMERGRDIQSVMDQYLQTVRPMHEEFVAPTKKFADLILSTESPSATMILKTLLHGLQT